MIAVYKNKKNSNSKIIKLFKLTNISKKNKVGIYNSKQQIFSYEPKYISSSLKLGNKISKNLIRLLLKNLNS
uniref:30S ribosomal protein S16 n=1 Tax=Nephromyces sp. ex Molgula occidentalis TaxID=2544991 RepID=A0A5C1H8Q4_9APIC|nr:hypothetical protein [Nephromyces sp. ex Molgula occidentalis]